MDRLHKKCVIVSAGLHLLLVLILFVGPAFLAPKTKFNDASTINFVPSILIDGAFSGGGNPNARPPAPRPQPQPVQQQTVTAPTPAPPEPAQPKAIAKVVATKDPEPESFEPAKDRKRTPDVSTTLVKRPPNKPKESTNSDAQNQAKQLAAAQQRLADQFRAAASSLRDGASDATRVEGDFGPGGGGPSYASYASWVRSVYENAWVAPQDSSMDDAVTRVTVTISRDGTVISSRITNRSGDSQMDASVQRALDRVTTVGRPFPEGAKDNERTYVIPFNLKAKRGMA